MKKAIVTVLGKDRAGIIAGVSTLLAGQNVNILDINQTIMRDYFTMVMLVDVEPCAVSFAALKKDLKDLGAEMNLSVHIQQEEIFNAMHNA